MAIEKRVSPVTVWIIDYDLPEDSNRRAFYRALRRYREEHKLMDGSGWSTQSVVITADKEFAKFVYELASHVGRANLYRALPVTSHR
jgi:hypothetical protein